MSRVLPILFNTEMVRAILDGRKTVTRRVMKPQPMFYTGRKYVFSDDACPKKWEDCSNIIDTYKYQSGDILYVRETWQYIDFAGENNGYVYKASENGETWETESENWKWRPSIHMPKEAARIWLKVKDVRVGQLQEIDDEGVISEGLEIGAPFDELWDSTIKKSDLDRYGWDANLWVWVIEFERCEKPED